MTRRQLQKTTGLDPYKQGSVLSSIPFQYIKGSLRNNILISALVKFMRAGQPLSTKFKRLGEIDAQSRRRRE